jgi:hypothetical protein
VRRDRARTTFDLEGMAPSNRNPRASARRVGVADALKCTACGEGTPSLYDVRTGARTCGACLKRAKGETR